MVVTTAGCLGEWTLVSNCMVKQKGVVAYESFRNSWIIHKENLNKRYLCLMSVFISDVDTAKLYIQCFRPLAQCAVSLINGFWVVAYKSLKTKWLRSLTGVVACESFWLHSLSHSSNRVSKGGCNSSWSLMRVVTRRASTVVSNALSVHGDHKGSSEW